MTDMWENEGGAVPEVQKAEHGSVRQGARDWERAWEVAAHDSYVMSPAYDAHCFDPLPEQHHTPRGKGSLKSGVPLDEILKAKKPGRYTTLCPIHDDAQASLSVLITEDNIIVHCFAGCDWREVKDYIRKHS